MVTLKVPMTPTLEKLLNPDLFRKEPIFTRPLTPLAEGERVYELSPEDIIVHPFCRESHGLNSLFAYAAAFYSLSFLFLLQTQ